MENVSVIEMARRAQKASRILAAIDGKKREKALNLMSVKLENVKDELLEANKLDVLAASEAGISGPLLKRLEINEKVFSYMKKRLLEAAALPDPLGRTLHGHTQPSGLQVKKISVPLGVIGIIYESRPNVTTDAAAVCLKSGNAVILKGGSESIATNLVLVKAMKVAIIESGLPEDAVQLISQSGHEVVGELLKLDQYIDVIIPRGGKNLIRRISSESTIPVIKHYDGICHQYIASDADKEKAINLIINSKCQKVETCNSLESVLIDQKAVDTILPDLMIALKDKQIEIRGCPVICSLYSDANKATEEDWSTEYLDYILSVKVVEGVEEAVNHINTYGSGHTDGIITTSIEKADYFVKNVDSASVLVNASTRLSGGGDYGMGAVVGISTDKLHARGPVGPEELTSYKWIARGDGHLRI
ncbi:MAG: glutamate-5-semialdehyde dehydrogenase [Spirochaetaceae bacterium]|jgi:glutamate-5-semialdehyde dehydrogenase|nr:glutamate-5-semialdehyde dehydrogenase [Spirochaetaceae bacterium]